MKDFKSQYYISNIPWQRYIDYNAIPKFNIKYGDTIIFHYDLFYSVFKISKDAKGYSKNLFVAVINACLRYYQIIKNVYPYNKICVIIHLKSNTKIMLNFDTFKLILDMIPNFAVCDDIENRFDTENYKHIFYGCSSIYNQLKVAEKQKWSTTQGRLLVS